MNRLIDNFGRVHEYLRISITDRCNLRCRYCMPPGGVELKPKDTLLTFEEIVDLAEIFVDLGIRKIRITGGEPLVRSGVEDLCARLASIPKLEALALSTNGVLLSGKAQALKLAGVQDLNVSLDTLRPERFERIALRANHEAVLRGIHSALRAGFRAVKINTVVMKGCNDDELLDFVEFATAYSLNVRFIEYMPFLGNSWSEAQFLAYPEMKEVIESKYHLVPLRRGSTLPGPAKEFQVVGSGAIVGFITTMSEHFCADCNRLRLTADGRMWNCLFAQKGTDLKGLLRGGAGRGAIQSAIRAGVLSKWEKHPETEDLVALQNQTMIGIGG